MPPVPLVDLCNIDLDKVVFDRQKIEEVNPHRFEMQQLDAIIFYDPQQGIMVGYKDVKETEFWVRGHIPDRPIMPGVLMIEAAAQLVSFAANIINKKGQFYAFGGIGNAKFRESVTPPCRLYLIAKLVENRARRFVCDTQGFVNDQMVFQARITGMPF